MKKTIFAVAAFSVIISISVKASEQMAIWDFGQSSAYYTEAPTAENVIGTPTLAISGGQKDVNGKNGVAYVDIAGVSHIAGQTGAWDDVKVRRARRQLDCNDEYDRLAKYSREVRLQSVGPHHDFF